MIHLPPTSAPERDFLDAAKAGHDQNETDPFYNNFAGTLLMITAVRVSRGEQIENAHVTSACEKLLMQHALAARGMNPGSSFIELAHAAGWRVVTRFRRQHFEGVQHA